MLKRMIIFLLKLSAFGSVLTVAVTTFVGLGDGLEHSGVTVAVVTVLFYSWAWLAYSCRIFGAFSSCCRRRTILAVCF